jgi:hypothetical protein
MGIAGVGWQGAEKCTILAFRPAVYSQHPVIKMAFFPYLLFRCFAEETREGGRLRFITSLLVGRTFKYNGENAH